MLLEGVGIHGREHLYQYLRTTGPVLTATSAGGRHRCLERAFKSSQSIILQQPHGLLISGAPSAEAQSWAPCDSRDSFSSNLGGPQKPLFRYPMSYAPNLNTQIKSYTHSKSRKVGNPVASILKSNV